MTTVADVQSLLTQVQTAAGAVSGLISANQLPQAQSSANQTVQLLATAQQALASLQMSVTQDLAAANASAAAARAQSSAGSSAATIVPAASVGHSTGQVVAIAFFVGVGGAIAGWASHAHYVKVNRPRANPLHRRKRR